MKNILILSALFLMITSYCFSDNIPTVQWDIKAEKPSPFNFSIRRGETRYYMPRFLNYGVPQDLTNASSLFLRYTPVGTPAGTWYHSLPIVVTNAGNGQLWFRWTPANESTGAVYNYEMAVTSSNGTSLTGTGTIELTPGIGQGGTGAPPVAVRNIDWMSTEQTGGRAVLSNQIGSGLIWSNGFLVATGSVGSVAGDTSWYASTDAWNTVTGRAQVCGITPTTNFSVRVDGGGVLVGQVATLVLSSSVFCVASTPISSFSYDTDAGFPGAALIPQYWYSGQWNDTIIYPCYTAGVFFASQGPEPVTSVTVSNFAVNVFAIPGSVGKTNDFRGTVLNIDPPASLSSPATLQTVNDAVEAVNPAEWAMYPAVDNIRMNGHLILNSGWGLSMTSGVGIISYGDVWASTNAMTLAHNGIPIITLSSGYSGLNILGFTVLGATNAEIWVNTNGVMSAPIIQSAVDLVSPNWQVVSAATSYPGVTNVAYRYQFATVAGGFYRAVQLSGTNIVQINGTLIINGKPITSGSNGVNGSAGANGTNGYTPIKGVDYFDGINGTNGAPGPVGPTGTVDTLILNAYSLTGHVHSASTITNLSAIIGEQIRDSNLIIMAQAATLTNSLMVTNNTSGTDTVGTIVLHGQVMTVGSNAPWAALIPTNAVQIGGVTGTPWAAMGYITNAVATTNTLGWVTNISGVVQIGTGTTTSAASIVINTATGAVFHNDSMARILSTNIAPIVSSITISGLPSCTNYRLLMQGATTNAYSNFQVRLNGMTAGYYDYDYIERITETGPTAGSAWVLGRCGAVPTALIPISWAYDMRINNFNGTIWSTWQGGSINGNYFIAGGTGKISTNAFPITSITIYPSSGGWSNVTLNIYGDNL